jgi:hypothetical protein
MSAGEGAERNMHEGGLLQSLEQLKILCDKIKQQILAITSTRMLLILWIVV